MGRRNLLWVFRTSSPCLAAESFLILVHSSSALNFGHFSSRSAKLNHSIM